MYRSVLQGIENVAIWPIVSFFIFFTFFLAVIWWVFSVDKSFLGEMSNKPLEDNVQDDLTEE